MGKKLYFNWSVVIQTEEKNHSRTEMLFHDKYEITEQEMLELFKNKALQEPAPTHSVEES